MRTFSRALERRARAWRARLGQGAPGGVVGRGAAPASRRKPASGVTRAQPSPSALLLALVVALPALAQVGDTSYRLRDPAQEERAREIGRELRCLVCQNQSIEDSDASLARDLRKIVREQIEQGRSNEEVMRFVHDRYGDFVLLRPPFRWSTFLLWATPALAITGGLLAIFVTLRRRTAAPAGLPELTEAERQRLAAIANKGPNPSR
ncbi:MAG: cytochrome c-type biogenesis protein CcmH [Acetobacteraceae bacterium]|nr:cytochrome c-type biogenesis protein CcmH [Acetobacteraceae bacterium]